MATMSTTFLTVWNFMFSHSVYSYVLYSSHSNKKYIYVMETAVIFHASCDLGRIQPKNVFPVYSGWKIKMKFLKTQALMALKWTRIWSYFVI